MFYSNVFIGGRAGLCGCAHTSSSCGEQEPLARCPAARGSFPDRGLNRPPALAGEFLTTTLQGNPAYSNINCTINYIPSAIFLALTYLKTGSHHMF